MSNLKVQDLSKEEQEKLVQEAYSVGLRGQFAGWGVETLKNKIAEKREQQNGNNTDVTPTEDGDGNDTENTTETDKNDENNSNETPDNVGQDNAEETGKTVEAKTDKKGVKNGICHICRSVVIDGKCTGCGFEV